MDSGNSSASSQSSGGGDDETYTSRADFSSLFNATASSTHHHHHHHQQPSLHHNQQQQQQLMFDPSSVLSNYFDPLTRSAPPASPSPLLNLDTPWPRSPRPDPSCTDLGIPSQQSPFLGFGRGPSPGGGVAPVQFPPAQESSKPVQGQATALSAGDNGNNAGNTNAPVRNPKKRSRASRRAPTTVLTTDTTNFRAMVQEFTGIPAPPFAASPFQRSRLDLFGSALRSGHLDMSSSQPPPYLLRPFAQRYHHPPPTSSSAPSFLGPPAGTTTNVNTSNSENVASGNNSATNTSAATNAAPPLPLGLLKHPQNLLINMNAQNPILDFGSSLFQASLKYPNLPGPSAMDGGPTDHHSHSNLRMGALEDFGLSHTTRIRPPSTERTLTNNDDTSAAATNWGDRGVGDGGDHHQRLLSSLGGGGAGNYGDDEDHPQRSTNGRVFTYSGNDDSSAGDRFHGDRGAEGATINARSEGMVESWICSSD